MASSLRQTQIGKRTWIGRRVKNERGAALVESALVFMPLCLIIFGIIEYGFIFKDSLTLSSATRAGVRTASAEPLDVGFYDATIASVTKAASAANFQANDELWIYQDNGSGLPTSSTCTSGTCQRYLWNTSTHAFALAGASGSWPVASHQACLGASGATGMDSVGIKLRHAHKSITGFIPKPLFLSETTVMRFEPQSNC